MNQKHKVIISKEYIKNTIIGDISYAEALAELVGNSLKAYERNDIGECCDVNIIIDNNLISVVDKSGGLSENSPDSEVFKINKTKGTGIKKAVFKLGNEITIVSKAKYGVRRLYLDFDTKGEELFFYNNPVGDYVGEIYGTEISISKLDNKTLASIESREFLIEIKKGLGRVFGHKINANKLRIRIHYMGKEYEVSPYSINGKFIAQKEWEEIGGKIILYKKENELENKGVDIYINDYLIKDRINILNKTETGYSFKDCIIEVIANGEVDKINLQLENIRQILNQFVDENSKVFKARKINIQFEADAGSVEKLKEYYNLHTAKALGEKAFELLCNKYKHEKDNKNQRGGVEA